MIFGHILAYAGIAVPVTVILFLVLKSYAKVEVKWGNIAIQAGGSFAGYVILVGGLIYAEGRREEQREEIKKKSEERVLGDYDIWEIVNAYVRYETPASGGERHDPIVRVSPPVELECAILTVGPFLVRKGRDVMLEVRDRDKKYGEWVRQLTKDSVELKKQTDVPWFQYRLKHAPVLTDVRPDTSLKTKRGTSLPASDSDTN